MPNYSVHSSHSSESPHSSDENIWEDIDDIENRLSSTPPSTTSVRAGMSSPRKRRPVFPRKQATPSFSRTYKSPRRGISQDQVLDSAYEGASFTFRYSLSVLGTAIRWLRLPLGALLFLWLLSLIMHWASGIISGFVAPFCFLPGLRGSGYCVISPQMPGEQRPPRWADYPRLIDVQSSAFEHLLDDSVGGSGLSIEIKRAEIATKDLATLVRISDLKARDALSDMLGEFVDNAKKTGRDLHRLSSKVGGAVDSIMAINDYALHQIEEAEAKPPTIVSLYGLIPWAENKPTKEVVLRTFSESMTVMHSTMVRLILEAQLNLANLEKLEERLSTVHEIASREGLALSSAKSELLADLWTVLGGNRHELQKFEEHLSLLKNLDSYRKRALSHVVAALQSLETMNSDMEDIRERVVAPELAGPTIPIKVHMASIRTGLERLKGGRNRSKKLEEDTLRRALGIAESDQVI